MPVIKSSIATQRGSGIVASGDPVIIKLPTQTRIFSIAAQATSSNTIKVEFCLDYEGQYPLWITWSHGEADDSQVWSSAFEGGVTAIRITGDGQYNYSWD